MQSGSILGPTVISPIACYLSMTSRFHENNKAKKRKKKLQLKGTVEAATF